MTGEISLTVQENTRGGLTFAKRGSSSRVKGIQPDGDIAAWNLAQRKLGHCMLEVGDVIESVNNIHDVTLMQDELCRPGHKVIVFSQEAVNKCMHAQVEWHTFRCVSSTQ